MDTLCERLIVVYQLVGWGRDWDGAGRLFLLAPALLHEPALTDCDMEHLAAGSTGCFIEIIRQYVYYDEVYDYCQLVHV